jgi:geranylgeranyl diphosphate synthase type II
MAHEPRPHVSSDGKRRNTTRKIVYPPFGQFKYPAARVCVDSRRSTAGDDSMNHVVSEALSPLDAPRTTSIGAFDLVTHYLAECRSLVLDEIKAFIPDAPRYRSVLYELMLDYPLREAKALRPALAIATCRALGGSLEGVLKSAAVLEFYHNAFLIHDDIEDGSEKRRDESTLHRAHGIPIAINVGDAMLALALEPLLDNMRLLGMGKALRILQAVARMARESAEGQAIELSWVRNGRWDLGDREYLLMVYKKTAWYTFITPMLIGGMVAGADEAVLRSLRGFATSLGLAFQIRDDVLNLSADEKQYGKEILGDLWEGKHTLALMHMMRSASARERARAVAILAKPRPSNDGGGRALLDLVDELLAAGDVSERAARALRSAHRRDSGSAGVKTQGEVEFLFDAIRRYRSIEYARGVASRRADRAKRTLSSLGRRLAPSVHVEFLQAVTDFVIERDR